jgi:hypothetical protein
MNPRAPQGHNVVTQSLAQIGNCGLFLLTLLAAIPRSFRYVRETIRQLWFVGAMSLTIIMVCGLFVGMVLMLQLYHVLSIFGGTSASGMVVALSVYRELGPVVTALLFAGRAGTSITAEIGLMRATDQIDAMEMMAVDPIAYVATPRFLAVLRDGGFRRSPGWRELAGHRQRHVLVEHDRGGGSAHRHRQWRAVQEPGFRRRGIADCGVSGLHHAADQRGRGLRHHPHGGRFVDRHPGTGLRAYRVSHVSALK